MKFLIHLAFRYLRGRKKIVFTTSNSLSLFGIALAVFSLLVISSVMNGFEADMRDRVIGTKAEIKIYEKDFAPLNDYENLAQKIENIEFVKVASPVCETELLIQNKKNISAIICMGIDLEKHAKVTDFYQKFVVGAPENKDLEEDGIILGLDLSLSINATVGEYVQISSPIGSVPSPFGLLPKSKKLKVVGIFLSGMPEYDQVFTYISLKNAQYLLGWQDEVSYLEVRTFKPEKAMKIATQINELFPEYYAEDWSIFEKNLFNAIKMEKTVMFLVLALMIIIASFNMSGNFIKMVAEKKSEIGILKALGIPEKQISSIFFLSGTIIGIIGTISGMLLAITILWIQQKYHLISIPIAGFPLQWIPVKINISDLFIIPIVSMIISILTTIYPAHKTLQIETIKIIQNNVR
ncbi:MAG: ABC transporter permease [Candidatus Cloacimonetes bacterium]|nr:ABC transporter permease [Candidatus Cloacimonadota bacterium]